MLVVCDTAFVLLVAVRPACFLAVNRPHRRLWFSHWDAHSLFGALRSRRHLLTQTLFLTFSLPSTSTQSHGADKIEIMRPQTAQEVFPAAETRVDESKTGILDEPPRVVFLLGGSAPAGCTLGLSPSPKRNSKSCFRVAFSGAVVAAPLRSAANRGKSVVFWNGRRCDTKQTPDDKHFENK